MPNIVQGDHGGQRLGFVDFDLVVGCSTIYLVQLGQVQIGQKWQWLDKIEELNE